MSLALVLIGLALGSSPDAAAPVEQLASLDEVRAALSPGERPLLVHFWALWCPSCMEELPSQVELARLARAQGADVLFINLDVPGELARVKKQLKSMRSFGAARHVQLAETVEPGDVTRLVDPRWNAGIPATFVLLPGGAIAARTLGPISAADRENLLSKLRAPKAVQPAARPAAGR